MRLPNPVDVRSQPDRQHEHCPPSVVHPGPLQVTLGQLMGVEGFEGDVELDQDEWQRTSDMTVEQVIEEYPACLVFAEWLLEVAGRVAEHLREAARAG